MATEGADFEPGTMPPVGVLPVVGSEDAEREGNGDGVGASILIGLVMLAIAALSGVAVWLGS